MSHKKLSDEEILAMLKLLRVDHIFQDDENSFPVLLTHPKELVHPNNTYTYSTVGLSLQHAYQRLIIKMSGKNELSDKERAEGIRIWRKRHCK